MNSVIVPPGLRRQTRRVTSIHADRPITFEQFLDMFGPKDFVELVDGMVVEKPMVQWTHESIVWWFGRLLGDYVEARKLGVVAGSRTVVQIDEMGGRMPDLLFIRADRTGIVQEKAVFGAPDLVIEVRSPSNRPADLIALEADYRNAGVLEIVFIDPPSRSITAIRRREEVYERETMNAGPIRLESVPDFEVQVEWLFDDSRPPALDVLRELLDDREEL